MSFYFVIAQNQKRSRPTRKSQNHKVLIEEKIRFQHEESVIMLLVIACHIFGVCVGSFAGLVFFSLYLAGKIRAFDRKGHVTKICLVILPWLAATFVGITLIDDYWHHWNDVVAGALLGLCHLFNDRLEEKTWPSSSCLSFL